MANSGNIAELKDIEHHKQQELCETRPAYRRGRNLSAVKVYTVNLESQHLFIYGVPQINLRSEVKSLCSKFGKVLNIHVVQNHQTEIFTECYHVQYERLQSARIAKRLLDNKSFYGGVLHVCYSPEQETLQETKMKLTQRIKDVTGRLNNENLVLNSQNQNELNLEEISSFSKTQIKKKRKQPNPFTTSKTKFDHKHFKSNTKM